MAQIRRRTRAKYHQAIKKCLGDEKNVIRNKISDNLKHSDSKQFWNTISKLNRKKNNACVMIDDKVGNEACNVFHDKYKNLYNKNPSVKINDIQESIRSDIMTKCIRCDDDKVHMHVVVNGMVKEGVKRLKSSQYDEHSKLMSDSIICGSDKLFVILSVLYTIMLRHGYSNDVLNTVSLVPIPIEL